MLRKTFIIAAILALLIGCRPPASTTGGIGNSSAVLKEVFDSALGGYRLENAEILWSGADSDLDYSRRGTVTVKEARQNEVADLLDKQLEDLPTKHNWKGHGSARTGDRYLGLNYEENGGKYYVDFIITQKDQDVDILVLTKGWKR